MGIRTTSEIIELVKQRIGEDTSDDAISLIEDISDTLNDKDAQLSEDWKTKYETNDAEWRQRYIDRFSGKTGDTEQPAFPDGDDGSEKTEAPKTYADLFTTE